MSYCALQFRSIQTFTQQFRNYKRSVGYFAARYSKLVTIHATLQGKMIFFVFFFFFDVISPCKLLARNEILVASTPFRRNEILVNLLMEYLTSYDLPAKLRRLIQLGCKIRFSTDLWANAVLFVQSTILALREIASTERDLANRINDNAITQNGWREIVILSPLFLSLFHLSTIRTFDTLRYRTRV